MTNELDRLMTITDLSDTLGVPVDTSPVPPQYANLLLFRADRNHVVGDSARCWPADGLHWWAWLADGFVGGGSAARPTLVVKPLSSVPDPRP